jgi:hypothetical protein
MKFLIDFITNIVTDLLKIFLFKKTEVSDTKVKYEYVNTHKAEVSTTSIDKLINKNLPV